VGICAGAASRVDVIAMWNKVNVKQIVMRNELLNLQIIQLLCGEERAANEQWE
jgi:hypothetical protein